MKEFHRFFEFHTDRVSLRCKRGKQNAGALGSLRRRLIFRVARHELKPIIGHLFLISLAHATVNPRCFQATWRRSGIPSEIGAHFRAQANLSVRSSFFNAASALSASDLLAKACAAITRTGG